MGGGRGASPQMHSSCWLLVVGCLLLRLLRLLLLLLLLLLQSSSYCSWTECGHERRQPLKKRLEGGWGGGRSACPPDALQPVGCWLLVVCCCILGFRIGCWLLAVLLLLLLLFLFLFLFLLVVGCWLLLVACWLLLLLLLHLGSSYCSWTKCGHERRQP